MAAALVDVALDVADELLGFGERRLLIAGHDGGHVALRHIGPVDAGAPHQLGIDPQEAARSALVDHHLVVVEAHEVGAGAVPLDGGEGAADDAEDEQGEQQGAPREARAPAPLARFSARRSLRDGRPASTESSWSSLSPSPGSTAGMACGEAGRVVVGAGGRARPESSPDASPARAAEAASATPPSSSTSTMTTVMLSRPPPSLARRTSSAAASLGSSRRRSALLIWSAPPR